MPQLSRTAKASFLAIGRISDFSAFLIISIFLSRLLSKEEYATFRQTLLTYQLVSPLLSLGLPAAILYFLPRTPEKARSTIVEILLVVAGTGGAFSLFMLSGGAEVVAEQFNNPELTQSLEAFAYYPLFTLPSALIVPTLVTQDKALLIPFFSLWIAVVRLISATLPIFLISKESVYAAQGIVIGSVMIFVSVIVTLNNKLPKQSVKLEFEHTLKLVRYSFPISLGTVVATVNKNIDKFLVATFAGPSTFAVFVNGAIEIPLMEIISGSASQILLPETSLLYEQKEYGRAVDLFRRSTIKCALILFPISTFAFSVAPEMMVLLYGEEYRESAFFFRAYTLLMPNRIMVWGTLLNASGNTKIAFNRALLGTVINLIGSIVLIKTIGVIGVVIMTVTTILIFNSIFNDYHVRRIYGETVFNKKTSGFLGLILLISILAPTVTGIFFERLAFSEISSTSTEKIFVKFTINLILYGNLFFIFRRKIK
ncbi:MAG: oligosaccharide flippase family protein [Cyanobacteria bacterium P01_F01_bin.56]